MGIKMNYGNRPDWFSALQVICIILAFAALFTLWKGGLLPQAISNPAAAFKKNNLISLTFNRLFFPIMLGALQSLQISFLIQHMQYLVFCHIKLYNDVINCLSHDPLLKRRVL